VPPGCQAVSFGGANEDGLESWQSAVAKRRQHSLSETFTCDTLNRLTSAVVNLTPVPLSRAI